jgi:excinuclease ABC subunit B
MDDLVNQIFKQRKVNEKTFITVLTIKMAEELTDYLKERKIKAAYLHNKLTSLERTKVILDLRKGVYDCIVGINLLREGLDVPEVSLVAILDADKTGLFRNDKSLIQMIGRAARNINGRVVMYADNISDSMKFSISETERRRKIQNEYNIKNNIIPTTITKSIKEGVFNTSESIQEVIREKSIPSKIKKLKKLMLEAAKNQNYELAAIYKSEITELSIINDSNKEKNTKNS